MMRFKDKVVVVTGVGQPRGVGRAVALSMAREGADLVLVNRSSEGAEALAKEIREMGRRAMAVKTDISKEDQVQAMVAAALNEYGRIDVLVNNAAVFHPPTPLEEISVEDWDFMMAVNLRGPFLCTKAVVPTMISQKSSRIVFVGSLTAEMGGGRLSPAQYSASKGGVHSFAKTVARQMAPYGITSNVVAAGNIDNDMGRDFWTPEWVEMRRRTVSAEVPLGRLASAQDIAEAVLFLASDGASYITGEVLDVNGGKHID